MKMAFICQETASPDSKMPPRARPEGSPARHGSSTSPKRSTANGAPVARALLPHDQDKGETAGKAKESSGARVKTETEAMEVDEQSTPDTVPNMSSQPAANGVITQQIDDHENAEDDAALHAPWEDIDLHPAVDLVSKVITSSLEAGKTYNKSITAKTTQLLTGCDNVLLELKNLSDAREASRKRSSKQGSNNGDCACDLALAMLPNMDRGAAHHVNANAKKQSNSATPVDEMTEDQTDRVLFRLEASVERLRELAELIQATSMQGEANLIAKVKVHEGALDGMNQAIQAAAAQATATAISLERGQTSSAFNQLYSPLQAKKLEEWYQSYPRPLMDELTLMRSILNYRPYANPFLVNGLSIAHVRDWFKRRRYRERMRFVKIAMEAGRDGNAAEEEIDLRIEQRIDHLRETIDPNELVKELDKVRAESSYYDAVVSTFTRQDRLDSYTLASHALPTLTEHLTSHPGSRPKRPRTQETELDEALVVKVGNKVEVSALQNRIQSLLAQPRSASSTNALQQVVDILRSLDISKDVRVRTGIVADLKQILQTHRKPTLLRKATISLLESLGINRRSPAEDDFFDDEPTPVEAPSTPSVTPVDVKPIITSPSTSVTNSTPKSRGKREKGKISRPMKFSMKQVMALEAWFQQKYKPTQSEMEDYLVDLNRPPLRDEKQTVDVNMTQLRRWFNKRRCLRRPPFALMTHQDSTKEDFKIPDSPKASSVQEDDHDAEDTPQTPITNNGSDESDDSNDDSSDGDSSDDE